MPEFAASNFRWNICLAGRQRTARLVVDRPVPLCPSEVFDDVLVLEYDNVTLLYLIDAYTLDHAYVVRVVLAIVYGVGGSNMSAKCSPQ